jgi:Flp pilus assembly protein TadB
VQVILQTMFVILWIAGLIALVVGIWYGGSLLVLAAVSKLLPLTGRRRRAQRHNQSSSID